MAESRRESLSQSVVVRVERLKGFARLPQRLLRPQLRQSKRWNRLSLFGQSLFVRLLTLVDDHGRYEADPELIRSEAFPYGDSDGKAVAVADISRQLSAFASETVNMISLYESDGKPYLQLLRWRERVRSESKFPDPENSVLLTNDSKCQQMTASPPSPSPSPIAIAARNGDSLADAETILAFLNVQTGSDYRAVESNLNLIRTRMKEHKATIEEIQTMIIRQSSLWKGTEMEQYLRPSTLFGKEKFAGYFGARNKPAISKQSERDKP